VKESLVSYENVHITNWTTSWWDGLAYCALIHRFHPREIDYKSLTSESRMQNLKLAFDTAERLGVDRFLDEEDMETMPPEQRSNITYVIQMRNIFLRSGRR
jgi:hypothetical protein